jgi:hypothetical protein
MKPEENPKLLGLLFSPVNSGDIVVAEDTENTFNGEEYITL